MRNHNTSIGTPNSRKGSCGSLTHGGVTAVTCNYQVGANLASALRRLHRNSIYTPVFTNQVSRFVLHQQIEGFEFLSLRSEEVQKIPLRH